MAAIGCPRIKIGRLDGDLGMHAVPIMTLSNNNHHYNTTESWDYIYGSEFSNNISVYLYFYHGQYFPKVLASYGSEGPGKIIPSGKENQQCCSLNE